MTAQGKKGVSPTQAEIAMEGAKALELCVCNIPPTQSGCSVCRTIASYVAQRVKQEREACARVADEHACGYCVTHIGNVCGKDIASSIRSSPSTTQEAP